MEQPLFETVTWEDVRDRVMVLNPEMGKLIDDISPDKRYPLIRVTYPYGDLIIRNGRLSQFKNPKFKSFIKHLDYSPIPLALILSKSCEVFVGDATDAPKIPLNIINAGDLFGTFEAMNYLSGKQIKPIWNVCAGARTIFMLPKITDTVGIKRLQRAYNIPSDLRLCSLIDHFEVFKHIAQHHPKGWESQVLFFTAPWFEKKHTSVEWTAWREYLLRKAWEQAQYAMERFGFGIFWRDFANILTKRNLKPRPYLVDTIKHLFLICSGSSPTLMPADYTDDTFAPIALLKRAFVEVYQLRHYRPTMMHATMLSTLIHATPAYYSLSFPTLLEGSPQKYGSGTIMHNLKEIKFLIDTLQMRSPKNALPDFLQDVEFKYYHVEKDLDHEIEMVDKLFEADPRFLKEPAEWQELSFGFTSQFLRGVVMLRKG